MLHMFASPTIGRVPVYRLLSPYLNPVIRLQNSVPVLKRLINVCLQQFPDPNVRKLKAIVDTMDATSRMIYQQKRDALAAGEVGLRLKVEEGRDLMSVLCASRRALGLCIPVNTLIVTAQYGRT